MLIILAISAPDAAVTLNTPELLVTVSVVEKADRSSRTLFRLSLSLFGLKPDLDSLFESFSSSNKPLNMLS